MIYLLLLLLLWIPTLRKISVKGLTALPNDCTALCKPFFSSFWIIDTPISSGYSFQKNCTAVMWHIFLLWKDFFPPSASNTITAYYKSLFLVCKRKIKKKGKEIVVINNDSSNRNNSLTLWFLFLFFNSNVKVSALFMKYTHISINSELGKYCMKKAWL